jgi:uncharacterized protein (TIGR02646 family)
MIKRKIPVRNCSTKYSNYRQYKPSLVKDFDSRCGYCDVSDHILGGKKVFHIDHFAPKTRFPILKTDYANLIYSCPSCNLAKGDDWPMKTATPSNDGVDGYIDPTDPQYSKDLIRSNGGQILATTSVGQYIHKKLKLYLRKHEIFWKFEKIGDLERNVQELLSQADLPPETRVELEREHYKILKEFRTYYDFISVINSGEA